MKHLLLKYISKEEYVNDFLNGSLYMNSLYYFWNDYKIEQAKLTKERYLKQHPDTEPDSILINLGDSVFGQSDDFEGVIGTGLKEIEDFGKYPVFRSVGLGYCNVLSFYRLDLTFENNLCMFDTDRRMDGFGDFVVIVKNENEFVRRIKCSVDKLEYKFICGDVQYIDFGLQNQHHVIAKREEILDSIEEYITNDRDCFNKMSNYSWQNEWRIALYRGIKSTDAVRLEVGDLRDIVEVVPKAKLDETVQKILGHKVFMGGCDGNISRKKFKELLHSLGDNKVEEFCVIG